MITFRFIHEKTGDYDGSVTVSLDFPVHTLTAYCVAHGLSAEIVAVEPSA